MADQQRPYRSHKIPACERCRKRKASCLTEASGQPCRPCREANAPCMRSSVNKRTRHENDPAEEISVARAPAHDANGDSLRQDQPGESTTLVTNSAAAEDMDILDKYLTSRGNAPSPRIKSSRMVSSRGEPVFSLTVPRSRPGAFSPNATGKFEREIMEQILGPKKADVVRLFFDNFHSAFPILDKRSFLRLWERDPGSISSTLMCDIYAAALVYWSKSSTLCHQPCPDPQFAWNQAVQSLRQDFTAPTLSTIHAAVIDLAGRPVLGVMDNFVNLGRTVTVAQSLGLHRDPSNWDISRQEKDTRVRLWWAVDIHDKSSLAHGTPPIIGAHFCDVPLPPLSLLGGEASSFAHLCRLTKTLGSVLPLVYTVDGQRGSEIMNQAMEAETAVMEWRHQVEKEYSTFTTTIAGGCSAWLCHLFIRLLVSRMKLKGILAKVSEGEWVTSVHQSCMVPLRESARALIDFVADLQENQLYGFWLPYTAHLLSSAVLIYLRCAIDISERHAPSSCPDSKEHEQGCCPCTHSKTACVAKVQGLLQQLRRYKNDHGWELGDTCLQRCEEPVDKLDQLVNSPQRTTAAVENDAASVQNDIAPLALSELVDPSASIILQDASLDLSWDDFLADFGALP